MENTFLDQVHGKLIISCQALEGEPLHSSFIMARMARAAKMAGAPADVAQAGTSGRQDP